MFLAKDTFKTVIASTPLISIDLVINNDKGEFLLGKRINKPAKGYWFVPGGRVYKNETLEQALTRVSKVELGACLELNCFNFQGVYQHFYQESVFESGISTHYVVLAYSATVSKVVLNTDQHEAYDWFSVDCILEKKDVNQYTKDYFRGR
ncbi:GDP-mannose mannosyl hydrolase [Catenovulum sediminis]|uniref:GDP-mannose mannosyl hydrolase n=1 Tax=Catenovulum sediminis TaxID=1740262 RepID=A0ABV1RJV6_9ALTE